MKNNIISILALFGFLCSMWMVSSCDYKEIADADYFDEVIYMPAALHNVYMIDKIPGPRGESPTPGFPVRYLVHGDNNRFDVLLGVYRSGVYSRGGFDVDIAVRTDTIMEMIEDGSLPDGTEILPSDKYTLDNKVTIYNGEDLAKFDLAIDLNFLKNSFPDKKYAIGVEVSSTERETNPDFATTLILIDTKIMKPTAGFSFVASESDPKEITFTNTSESGQSYTWDFGDGTSGTSSETVVHTFPGSGDYTVSLTAIGITGEPDADTWSEVITIP